MRRAIALLATVLAFHAAAGNAGAAERSAVTGRTGSSSPAATSRVLGLDPRLLFPGDHAVPGWLRTEEPRLFDARTLFDYIDGGAEEFLAQGFRRLGVGGYRRDSLEAVAEIYQMGSRKGAASILEARGGSPEAPAVGEACALDSVQILFRRGSYFVSVTGFETRPQVASALRALADSIDARIHSAVSGPKRP